MVPASPSSTGRRRPRPGWVWVLLAILPWAWFLVRGTWPPLDMVAVGLPILGLAGLLVFGLVAALSGRLLALVAGLSTFAVALTTVFGPRVPLEQPRPSDGFRIVAANIFQDNAMPSEAAAVLAGRAADLLLVIEGDRRTFSELRTVARQPERISFGMLSVFSRWPIRRLPRPDSLESAPGLRLRIERPGSPFVVHVLHAPNPLYETTFEEQEALAAALVRAAKAEALPALVVGDLNLSDRAEGYRVLAAGMRDAMRAGTWPADTYRLHVWRALLLRIDHLFVPNDWCAADPMSFEVPGSDHLGIQATIGRCP